MEETVNRNWCCCTGEPRTPIRGTRSPWLSIVPWSPSTCPGHGHSDGPGAHPEGHLDVEGNAVDVAVAVRRLAPAARAVVGMSLGGLTTIALTKEAPDLVRKVVLVDILPGIKGERAKHIIDFVNGPAELRQPRRADGPDRVVQSDPVTVLAPAGHPAQRRATGRRHVGVAVGSSPTARTGRRLGRVRAGDVGYDGLWESLSSVKVPLLLARGMRPDSVLGDEDEEELRRRLPSARVAHVAEAGHSLQGDTPLELAALIEDFVFGS